jgi:hypothetical protein
MLEDMPHEMFRDIALRARDNEELNRLVRQASMAVPGLWEWYLDPEGYGGDQQENGDEIEWLPILEIRQLPNREGHEAIWFYTEAGEPTGGYTVSWEEDLRSFRRHARLLGTIYSEVPETDIVLYKRFPGRTPEEHLCQVTREQWRAHDLMEVDHLVDIAREMLGGDEEEDVVEPLVVEPPVVVPPVIESDDDDDQDVDSEIKRWWQAALRSTDDMQPSARVFNVSCIICADDDTNLINQECMVLTCGHTYCLEHHRGMLEHGTHLCPICRNPTVMNGERKVLTRAMTSSKPFPIFIMLPETMEVKVFEISEHDTIDHIKGQIQYVTGIRPDLQRLMFNSRILDGQMTASAAGITKESMLRLLAPPLLGSGKRARGEAGATRTRMNKETKLLDLQEEVGTSMLRLAVAQDAAAPSVREIYRKAMAFVQHIDRIDEPMTREVGLMSNESIQNITETIASNNNVEERLRVICDAVFSTDWVAMKETERQIQKSKDLMNLITMYAMIKQFGEPNGTVSWSKFSKMLNECIARGQAPAAAPGLGL